MLICRTRSPGTVKNVIATGQLEIEKSTKMFPVISHVCRAQLHRSAVAGKRGSILGLQHSLGQDSTGASARGHENRECSLLPRGLMLSPSRPPITFTCLEII